VRGLHGKPMSAVGCIHRMESLRMDNATSNDESAQSADRRRVGSSSSDIATRLVPVRHLSSLVLWFAS
jgi:hypothetical protein